jgi:hypothetical protein
MTYDVEMSGSGSTTGTVIIRTIHLAPMLRRLLASEELR